MGFGGGGATAFVSAHKHTNAAGDGGTLDTTTLYQSVANNFLIKSANVTTTQRSILTSNFTTSSASKVDTGITLTMPTRAGKTTINAAIFWSNTGIVGGNLFAIFDGATEHMLSNIIDSVAATIHTSNGHLSSTLAGQIIKIQCLTGAGTLTVYGQSETTETGGAITQMLSTESLN